MLSSRHGFHISERHLKRILSTGGHIHRKGYSELTVLIEFIRNQLQYSGQLHGYRWMCAKCREHGDFKQARPLGRSDYCSKGLNYGILTHMKN